MSRHSLRQIVLAVILLACPVVARAQDSTFVQAVADFVNAANGTRGDEGPAMAAAIDAMAAGLAEWDAAVARVEAGFAAKIAGAPPQAAARMRGALGAVYFERGRVDAAREQFDAAIALDPEFGAVQLLRGLAYQRLGRPMEAETAFLSAWQRDRDNAATAYLFLQAYGAAGAAASKDDTADASAAINVLSSAVEKGAAAERPQFPAPSFLDDAPVEAPVFPPARYADAAALLTQGKYAEAVASFRASSASDPLVTDRALRSDHIVRAAAASRENNAAAAIASAAAAAEESPSSSEVHRVYGIALWMGRQYEQSLAQLRMAVRLDPGDERSLVAIGDVLLASGDRDGARVAFDAAVGAVPKSGLAHWRLGRLHLAFGDERSALRSFEAAASIATLGGAGHLHAAIARLYHNQLDLEAAEAAYRRRVGATPNDSAAHVDLGEVLRAQEKLPGALTEYLVAALLDPASAGPLAMIGQVQVAAGRDGEAVRVLRRAVDLAPADMEARYALSRALMRLGNDKEAQEQLAIFQQLQSKAMEEERLRYRENLQKIEDALKAGERKDSAR